MTEARKTVRIFFSWQSDLNQEVTTRAIRAALRAAMTAVENDYPVDITLEEATSNVPGSPYIPYALADKISKADIFVGDITTVVRLGGQTGKSLPNANVTFELGIASAELGRNRIIILFNTALAELDELPFDFDRHRISKFNFSADAKARKSHESDLRKLAQAAIAQIVTDDPKRPRELLEIPPEQIKRSRDIENLRWFLQRIHTALLDEHILDMPTYLNYSAVVMFDGIDELQRRSDFLFYDPDLTATVSGMSPLSGRLLTILANIGTRTTRLQRRSSDYPLRYPRKRPASRGCSNRTERPHRAAGRRGQTSGHFLLPLRSRHRHLCRCPARFSSG
jgi:hypothetical protein